ncbi:MAG: SRPBCC domain-containing protein [Pseudomonadota bacterium]
MDEIFKALSDDTRRAMLDELHRKDGQTLGELEASVARAGFSMTRFGVMKHLKVLEAASLITTRKTGRFKHHYLNAIPLQQVIDRWIEPLTQKPLARAALDMKTQLEGEHVMSTSTQDKPDFVLETYIKTTPDKLWDAITNGAMTPKFFNEKAEIRGTIKSGEGYEYVLPDGRQMLVGEIIDATPTSRLEMTFVPSFMERPENPSRNVYEIESDGETCKLTIMHFGVTEEIKGVRQGWAKIAARLKTLLETGKELELA